MTTVLLVEHPQQRKRRNRTVSLLPGLTAFEVSRARWTEVLPGRRRRCGATAPGPLATTRGPRRPGVPRRDLSPARADAGRGGARLRVRHRAELRRAGGSDRSGRRRDWDRPQPRLLAEAHARTERHDGANVTLVESAAEDVGDPGHGGRRSVVRGSTRLVSSEPQGHR